MLDEKTIDKVVDLLEEAYQSGRGCGCCTWSSWEDDEPELRDDLIRILRGAPTPDIRRDLPA